jgi:nitroreductase
MEILEAIHTRRSVRKYLNTPVPEDLIDKILAAAMMAPSAGNQQPWQFVVIRKRELLDVIPDFHPYSEMVRQAPLAILVCGDLNLERFKGYWMYDCSAAIENILLAAHGLGLGAVWTAAYPEQTRVDGFRKLLNLPTQVVPLALIPIGYPSQTHDKVIRFNRTRIHYDGWDNYGVES